MTASKTSVPVGSLPEQPRRQARHRTYLYAPGHRPDVMRKALLAGADCVLLDLEDAVPVEVKAEAREHVREFLLEQTDQHGEERGPCEIHVRVNRGPDGYEPEDLDAAVSPATRGLRLSKAEDPRELEELDTLVGDLEAARGIEVGRTQMYPLIESALGLDRVDSLLRSSPRVVAACLGASDLLADLSIPRETRHGTLHLRSQLVVASRLAAAGPPIDSVHTDLGDADGLLQAARWARDLGFYGKSIIHPKQIAPVHEAFTPTADELARATRVLEAARRHGSGATRDGDVFIDPAVVAHAMTVLQHQRNS